MKKRLLAVLLLSLLRIPRFRLRAFRRRDIRVEGIQRTEAGTVFSYLPVKVGETHDRGEGRGGDPALYATGFFKDVRLEVEDDVLIVIVDERPAIAEIDVTGIKEFDKEDAEKGPEADRTRGMRASSTAHCSKGRNRN